MNILLRPRGRFAARRASTYRFPMIALLLALLLAGLLPAGVSAAPLGGWTPTGSLVFGHGDQATVKLNNGKILAVGGQLAADTGFGGSSLAMLYDPASGTWNLTGSLDEGRSGHTATLLANGKVLVAGGQTYNGDTKTAELYDPTTGQWSSAGMMAIARDRHTATLLATGKVLVAGGDYLQTTELYDPATNSWSPTGPMITSRSSHTAVRLASGKVLVVAGIHDSNVLASAELYNPATGTWSSTGNLATPRFYHAMTLLTSGMVLVTGGLNFSGNPLGIIANATVERYDPNAGAWTTLPSMQTPRAGHTMTTLPSGDVLVAGGFFAEVTLGSAEVYSPVGNSWYLTGGLGEPRLLHSSILLNSGKLLTFGGFNAEYPLEAEANTSSELYDPALAVTTYALSVLALAPGVVTSYPPGGVYPSGTTVVLRATPNPGDIFLGWSLDGPAQGWASAFAVTMDGPHLVEAVFAPRPSFPDVLSGNPAQEAIEQLAARGIIKGYGDGRFGPADTTLRAQMAAMICRAMGWNQEDHGNPFSDGNGIDANLWRNVGTLAHYNVAHGYGDGRFGPNDQVTRAQVISFITRAMIVKGYWQLQPDNPALFSDVPASSGHRQDLVTYRHYAGDLPEQQAINYPFSEWNTASTRGWFAQVLWQALDREFGDRAGYP